MSVIYKRGRDLQITVSRSAMVLAALTWLILALQLVRDAFGGTAWNPGWAVLGVLSTTVAFWSARSQWLLRMLSVADPQAHMKRSRAVWGLLVFVVLLVVVLKAGSVDVDAYKRMLFGERAPIELFQTLVLILAIRATWLVGGDLNRLFRKRVLGRIFRLGGGILLTFVLLEELAWGQVIFSWRTPELLSEINAQNETTLHNIGWFQDRLDVATFLVLLFVLVVVVLSPRFMRRLGKQCAPSTSVVLRALSPSSYSWPLFAAVAGLAFCIAARAWPEVIHIRDQEWGESVLYVSVLLYLMRAQVLLGPSQDDLSPSVSSLNFSMPSSRGTDASFTT